MSNEQQTKLLLAIITHNLRSQVTIREVDHGRRPLFEPQLFCTALYIHIQCKTSAGIVLSIEEHIEVICKFPLHMFANPVCSFFPSFPWTSGFPGCFANFLVFFWFFKTLSLLPNPATCGSGRLSEARNLGDCSPGQQLVISSITVHYTSPRMPCSWLADQTRSGGR